MKKLVLRLLLAPAIILVLAGCEVVFDITDIAFGSSSGSSSRSTKPYGQVGEERVGFSWRDMEDTWHVADAELRAHEPNSVFLYVERGVSLGSLTSAELVNQFSSSIRPIIRNKLGNAEFVDALGVSSSDRSIVVLILDLGVAENGAMLLGYFDPLHAFARNEDNPYSNEAPMVFLNSRVLTEWSESADENKRQLLLTLAHEFQHLNNFYYKVGYQGLGQMDTWIDEMLSAAAEYYYTGAVDTGRTDYFTGGIPFRVNGTARNYNPYVALGQNHVAWGQGWTDILTSYASVHMKMNWLRIHAGPDSNVFRSMVLAPYTGEQAVVEAAAPFLSGVSNWNELLRSWGAANRLRRPTGLYGYGGDPVLSSGSVVTLNTLLTDMNATLNQGKFELGPGEIVYVQPKEAPVFSVDVEGAESVRYARLTADAAVMSSGALQATEELMAYSTVARPLGPVLLTRALPLPDSLVTGTGAAGVQAAGLESLRVTPPAGPYGIDMVFPAPGGAVGAGAAGTGAVGGLSGAGAGATGARVAPDLDVVIRERRRAVVLE